MPLSTTARALDFLAKTPFSVSTTFEAFAARFGDPDQADAFPVPAVISAPLSFEEGMRLYREAARLRAETGLSPLVIAEEALSNLELSDWSPGQGPWAGTLEQRRRFEATSAEDFFASRATEGDPAEPLRDVLRRLEARIGRDPSAWLHRIDRDALSAFESGEEEDEDALLESIDEESPDDPREAYERARESRAATLADFAANPPALPEGWDASQFKLQVRVDPLRTHDEDSALAEMSDGRAVQVALFGGPPHLALLHLGFGGFNDCPMPFEHARVWERWFNRYGAEPVYIGSHDRLEGFLRRPCATIEELLGLVREVVLYDRDVLMDGYLPLAASLFRNASIGFWWD